VELVLTPRGYDLIPVLGPMVTARPQRIIRATVEVNASGRQDLFSSLKKGTRDRRS
jgi:hypothetical protein